MENSHPTTPDPESAEAFLVRMAVKLDCVDDDVRDILEGWVNDYNIEHRTPTDPLVNPGYHLRAIRKGKLGEVSKIREELEELEDATEQGVRIM